MTAYYSENDPHAAAWLRELIAEGHIADGVVDTRSIEDVTPNDIRGFSQHHFFAGIGGWSLALRQAAYPDDRPIWTGSCPCQPFSTAGQGKGFADERHLWPAFYWLISQCRPNIVFGEQVASALPWVDLVQGDLEAEGYTFGKSVLGAHSVGAPHIRQRLYWVAHDNSSRSQTRQHDTAMGYGQTVASDCGLGELAHGDGARLLPGTLARIHSCEEGARPRYGEPKRPGATGKPALSQHGRREGRDAIRGRSSAALPPSEADELGHTRGGGSGRDSGALPGEEGSTQRGVRSELDEPVTTSWTDCDWLPCRDGKFRPVETGTFPLAHGIPGRVGLLRGYGNAIVPEVAAKFIEAFG